MDGLPLTRLIAQWKRCGGDRCTVVGCKRCRRGAEMRDRINKHGDPTR